MISRSKEIIEYSKNHTLTETGEKFGITSERVRQIKLTKFRKRCSIHNRLYYNKCSYCLARQYKIMLRWMDYHQIEKEIEKESKNRKRDYLSVQRKAYLTEALMKRFNNSISQVASKLKRDRSTIVNLYNKHVGK